MKVYETNVSLPWAALCCTPVVGGIISFVGACKWGNRAAVVHSIGEAIASGKLAEDKFDESLLVPQYSKDIAVYQAFYTVTGFISSVISLGLMVQSAANPIFQVCAAWTALYGVSAYFAMRQAVLVQTDGAPSSSSIFVSVAWALNNSTWI